jgi:hypothetical protein
MHRLFAAAAVLDVVLAARRILDGIRLAVFAADEPLDRTSTLGAGLTTPGNCHSNATDDYTSKPKSIHCNSPRKGVFAVCIGNFGASALGRKPL